MSSGRPNQTLQRPGRHDGFPRYFVQPAGPAAELGRSAVVGRPKQRGSDGELVIFDGVTRATRAAKLAPGTPITVEVTGDLSGPVGGLSTVGEKL